MTGTLLVLGEDDIRAVLGPAAAVASQEDAYRAVTAGQVRAAGGTATEEPEVDGLVFALTGAITGRTGIACKFGYQAPSNVARGLPPVHAFVTLLDPVTGETLACLNGTTVTTMRTAAGLGAAAAALARPGSSRLTVLGSGVQAQETARMVAAVLPLVEVRVWSPSARREQLASRLREELDIEVRAAADAEDAVRDADVVACCTSSRSPVVQGSWLAPGSTVVTMGSYLPDRRETDLDCARRSAVVLVDEREKATATCGPLLEAFDAGVLRPADVVELGSVLAGTAEGRPDDEAIVTFHSVGLGVQDAALGWRAYESAVEQGLGQRVSF